MIDPSCLGPDEASGGLYSAGSVPVYLDYSHVSCLLLGLTPSLSCILTQFIASLQASFDEFFFMWRSLDSHLCDLDSHLC
jgi:hypothetical protein